MSVERRSRETASIAGVPGAPVEDIVLERVSIDAIGGGQRMTDPVPECEDAYPQCTMFGPLPAWGLYAALARRHPVPYAAYLDLGETGFSCELPQRGRGDLRHAVGTPVPVPEALTALIKQEYELWSRVVKAGGVKLE